MPNTTTNRLWLARQRLGLGQKQVAKLLANQTTHQLSRYENGQRLPSLKMALKLSVIYKLPIRVLFPTSYQACLEELRSRAGSLSVKLDLDLTKPTDYCSYIEMINSEFLNATDQEKVRRHIKVLMDERRVKILDH